MTNNDLLGILNELFAIEKFSLASYLRYASPWSKPNDEPLRKVIRQIGDEQQHFADRIGWFVVEHRGHVKGGSFPLRFTAFNDLSLDYLARRVMEDQEWIIREVRVCVSKLAGAPIAHSLALEVLDAEQAHLDRLAEMHDSCTSDAIRPTIATARNEICCGNPKAIVTTAA